ncbi:pilus assembly protein PilP [Rickettsiella massiliensis]|uniref:pilus assembly protein PilP n=1 Tax=Rickettsiella massiliensis TaxID=676517 RepID=UPI0003140E67|nr:pilus assembly protein PilP [Rickettsiella massiliensis]
MFLGQSKDQASLLLAHIQPLHFLQLKSSEKDRNIIFEEVSVSQLKFVGLFLETQSKKCWAIIQKANEQIRKVEIGDTLGFEHYVVIAIELKKIIVQSRDMKETIQLLL